MAIYFMDVASGGLKVHAIDLDNPPPVPPPPKGSQAMTFMHGSLSEFAAVNLSRALGRPVVDRTGIQGIFYLWLGWDSRADPEGPDILTALREQLGLRLEASKGPVDALIVDRVDKVPTEN
jgi:uncharacterized protein (TIGR03435 family)